MFVTSYHGDGCGFCQSALLSIVIYYLCAEFSILKLGQLKLKGKILF